MPLPSNKRLYLILVFTLLSMILSRLVWMQLRSYEIQPALRASVTFHSVAAPLAEQRQKESPQKATLQKQKTTLQATYFTLAPPTQTALTPAKNLWLSKPYFVFLGLHWLNSSTAETTYLRWHWLCVFLTTLAAMFASRFLSSSWLPALLVGAALLSRGAMLARIGALSESSPLAFFTTLWFATSLHFLRTGSFWTFAAAALTIIAGNSIDSAFASLALALPLLLCVHRSTQKPTFSSGAFAQNATQGQDRVAPAYRGHLFRPLPFSFCDWLQGWQGQKILQRLSWGLWAALVASNLAWNLVLLGWGQQQPGAFLEKVLLPSFASASLSFFANSQLWLAAQWEPIDLQFLASMASICLCACGRRTQNPSMASLPPYPEGFRLLLCGGLLLLASSWLLSLGEASLVPYSSSFSGDLRSSFHRPSLCLVWLEPIILTLGIVGLCHMLRRKGEKSLDLFQHSA